MLAGVYEGFGKFFDTTKIASSSFKVAFIGVNIRE